MYLGAHPQSIWILRNWQYLDSNLANQDLCWACSFNPSINPVLMEDGRSSTSLYVFLPWRILGEFERIWWEWSSFFVWKSTCVIVKMRKEKLYWDGKRKPYSAKWVENRFTLGSQEIVHLISQDSYENFPARLLWVTRLVVDVVYCAIFCILISDFLINTFYFCVTFTFKYKSVYLQFEAVFLNILFFLYWEIWL